ncbi:ADP-dependent (S)-NAD(P)H-hydrate dehydratase / NAD(P)H-hydrate epimerase [Burkholderiales bacterium 8X]|nr:ADP-dependent (S)-NAD(P)H-hydrate dehydratase / NAD(P)H-hydrate epimerase [Burkholderiales bacterium 8X]
MALRRIDSSTVAPLFGGAATRRIEAAATALLPVHELMERAGLATARLAAALAPHARTIWIACGPGNNGGDGLEAASQLRRRGFDPIVTLLGDPARLPSDAAASFARARAAGVRFADAPPGDCELAIDALLGLGSTRAPEGRMAEWLAQMQAAEMVLSIDLPSGLDADTGMMAQGAQPKPAPAAGPARARRACLSLLTLKPGLLTADGRDAAGELWFDDLGVEPGDENPCALLPGEARPPGRPHASHKGSYGDVAIIGGASGMNGAALLAATAALHAGAGRVFVGMLDAAAARLDALQPELMFRLPDLLDLRTMHVACGCGGGDSVRALLPRVLSTARSLVLDADALNAIAGDTSLQALLQARGVRRAATVLTPHPLEAARLLATDATSVQRDRLHAATSLARRFGAVVLLKGSGTIAASPNDLPVINPTGNARLATAGTGDVLAGMVASGLARQPDQPLAAAVEAAWLHGHVADGWPADRTFSAGELARSRLLP